MLYVFFYSDTDTDLHRPAAFFTLFSYLSQVALADFPLYIPGFDPQPLSGTVLGVGSDGRTTYQISPAKATDPNGDDSSNPICKPDHPRQFKNGYTDLCIPS